MDAPHARMVDVSAGLMPQRNQYPKRRSGVSSDWWESLWSWRVEEASSFFSGWLKEGENGGGGGGGGEG